MNPLRALKERFSPKKFVPQSQAEYLFATKAGAQHLDRVIAGYENDERNRCCFVMTNGILVYSGFKAKRLQEGMHDTIRKLEKTGITISNVCDEVKCSFDEMFLEVSALAFFTALQEYWNKEDEYPDDDDESEEKKYFDALKSSLSLADRFIHDFSSVSFPSKLLIDKAIAYSDAARRGLNIFEIFNRCVISRIVPDKEKALLLSIPFLTNQCMISYSTHSPDDLIALCRSLHRECSSGR